jgi:hypothetical protein
MKALKIVLAGGVAVAALAAAAPAAAQYYPGYPGYGNAYPGYGYGGNAVGQVLGQVLGGGYGGYGGYGANSQVAVSQCVNAVQARLGGNYGYSPYGYNNGAYGRGRVLGISRVEQRSNGGLTIRGVASTGMSAGYGYTPNSPIDLTFKCKTDYRGLITDVDLDRAQSNYGSNYNYSPYDPYAAYGYRRY